ncbi:MAG: helix-hairpin-helix domain-containing protein [Armatimonadota bacterium]|nr:helix-hairpin-helix domain-containing protein [bacterium]MDW8320217.1 helix-hairpin-helix domain-containing protein [Armatimonadota bacterium]
MERIPKGLWATGALVVVTCGVALWQAVFSGGNAPAPAISNDKTQIQHPPVLPTPISSGEGSEATSVPAQNVVAAENNEIVVHVAGAVKKPGVVRIPRGSRVDDAVKAAGGFSAQADPDSVNLAQLLEDGVQVYVPRKGEPVQVEGRVGGVTSGRAMEGTSSGRKNLPSGKININTANAEQLESLPGVGPAIAQAIIEYRRQNGGFQSVDELLEVSGIGPKKMEQIRPYVTVR